LEQEVDMDARERILEAALRVFAEAGTRGATTRRIAEAAGVNEVTLFRQFGSKDALLRDAIQWAAQQTVVQELPRDPLDPEAELTVWCREHLRGMYQARALLRTSMGEFETSPDVSAQACEVPTRLARELESYVQRLRERSVTDPAADTRGAAALLMGALFSDAVSRDIMPGRYPYSLDESAAMYVRLFLRAIGVRQPGEHGAGTSENKLF
jgi:AcrR family transcriptional regulator